MVLKRWLEGIIQSILKKSSGCGSTFAGFAPAALFSGKGDFDRDLRHLMKGFIRLNRAKSSGRVDR
jgi:hypothetical protein